MPIPHPRGTEEHDDFIERCMDEIGGEYEDNDQAVAICEKQWDDAQEDKAVVTMPKPVPNEYPRPQEGEEEGEFLSRCNTLLSRTMSEEQHVPRCQYIWDTYNEAEERVRGKVKEWEREDTFNEALGKVKEVLSEKGIEGEDLIRLSREIMGKKIEELYPEEKQDVVEVVYPEPNEGESEDKWFARCIPELIENLELDQSEAEEKCASIWESSKAKEIKVDLESVNWRGALKTK